MIDDELFSGRDAYLCVAARSSLSDETARARAEIFSKHVLLGPMAALHWRMALLVRRWRARRARRWELNELGPQEYPVCQFAVRLHAAAGCSSGLPSVVLVEAVERVSVLRRPDLIEGIWWEGIFGPSDADAGWEGRLAQAGREWWRHDMRRGWREALRELRVDRAERLFDMVEAGECAGHRGRWRTSRVVDARMLPSGGAVAMVEWAGRMRGGAGRLHVNSETKLIHLSQDERGVAWRIIHARRYAKKVALAAVRAVVARARAETMAVWAADGRLDRRSGRLVEVAAAANDAPARAVIASLVSDVLGRVVRNVAASAVGVDNGGGGGGRAAGAAGEGGRVRVQHRAVEEVGGGSRPRGHKKARLGAAPGSAQRALDARRAAAAEAAAAKQLDERRGRAEARAAAMQQRSEARAAALVAGGPMDSGGGNEGGADGREARPGGKRGGAEVSVAVPRGEEAKKRAPRGAGGRSASAGAGAQATMGVRWRPAQWDVVLGQNDEAYASYTDVGGQWLGGLFARRDLAPNDVIAKYEGALLSSDEARVSGSEYLMTAIDVQDWRRRVVIDGHPKFGGLSGFANYAAHRVANAVFEDQGKAARHRGDTYRTNVVLKAWVHIAAGQEIRVDYDMGVSGKPFREQMLKRGVAASELDGPGYAAARWADPGGLGSGGSSARAVVDSAAGACAAGGESVQGGTGSHDAAQASTTDAGGGVAARQAGAACSRKRGGADAAVATPRGQEGRKRAPRGAER